nr:immunoglobulin light chain junction region [Mus musculus]
CQQGNTLYTF